MPVVSTFDPDNLIRSRQLGFTSNDMTELSDALKTLTQSPDQFRHYSQNARQYYKENHTPETVMPKFEKLFLDVLNESRSGNTIPR